MTYAPQAGVHLQYAARINCEKNGCKPKHSDDGTVYFFADQRVNEIEGHAVDVLIRTVNFAPWVEIDSEVEAA